MSVLANLKFKTTKQSTHQLNSKEKQIKNTSSENFRPSKDIANQISNYLKACKIGKNLEYDNYFK